VLKKVLGKGGEKGDKADFRLGEMVRLGFLVIFEGIRGKKKIM
jgi:hypothetical protein